MGDMGQLAHRSTGRKVLTNPEQIPYFPITEFLLTKMEGFWQPHNTVWYLIPHQQQTFI